MASKRTRKTFVLSNGPSSTSDSQPSKKARSERDVELWTMITKLPLETKDALLYNACTQIPSVAAQIRTADQERIEQLRAKSAISFDAYPDRCWQTLNHKYSHLSGSKQFEVIGDVLQELETNRKAIIEKAGPEQRYETKRNALDALRRISKSIMLCDEPVIRKEIINDGYTLDEFAETMAELAMGMTQDERERFKDEGFYDKVEELQNHCDVETYMAGLQDVYDMFEGEDTGGRSPGDPAGGDGGSDSDSDVVEIVGPSRPSAPASKPSSTGPRRSSVFSVVDLV